MSSSSPESASKAGREAASGAGTASLEGSERMFRDLVEAAGELLWKLDIAGRFTFLNDAVTHLYGYAPEELLGRHFTTIVPQEIVAWHRSWFDAVIAGKEFTRCDSEHRRKDGTPAF